LFWFAGCCSVFIALQYTELEDVVPVNVLLLIILAGVISGIFVRYCIHKKHKHVFAIFAIIPFVVCTAESGIIIYQEVTNIRYQIHIARDAQIVLDYAPVQCQAFLHSNVDYLVGLPNHAETINKYTVTATWKVDINWTYCLLPGLSANKASRKLFDTITSTILNCSSSNCANSENGDVMDVLAFYKYFKYNVEPPMVIIPSPAAGNCSNIKGFASRSANLSKACEISYASTSLPSPGNVYSDYIDYYSKYVNELTSRINYQETLYTDIVFLVCSCALFIVCVLVVAVIAVQYLRKNDSYRSYN
jgi:hypothetical protein